jgi:transposase
MIPLPPSTRIFLPCGATDMRKGFDGLAVLVQQILEQSPHSGTLFAFRGKRGDLVKLLWYDGEGLCLFSKRMDRGRFVWPVTKTGSVAMTAAQLSMLLEGIDWRARSGHSAEHGRGKTPVLLWFSWHWHPQSAIE